MSTIGLLQGDFVQPKNIFRNKYEFPKHNNNNNNNY